MTDNQPITKTGSATLSVGIGVSSSIEVIVSKSLEWAVTGFDEALARYDARETANQDPSYALAEALTYLDVLSEKRPKLLGNPLVKGMVFARARTHHWLASILDGVGPGQRTWRPTSVFPPVTDPKFKNPAGERAYNSVLSGKPVRATLAKVSAAVHQS